MLTRHQSHHNQQGAILLMMLGMLALLVVFTLKFLEYAHRELRQEMLSGNQPQLRQEAYNLLEIALASIHEIKEIEGSLHGPAQGWGDPLKYAGEMPLIDPANSRITVWDESAKLSLSNLEMQQLRIIFEEMGVPTEETDSLADTLIDWMDEDDERRFNGAERDDYASADPPYRAPNRPLQSWQELRLIQGFAEWFFDEQGIPNQNFTQFTQLFSLYHQGASNINQAPQLLIDVYERMFNLDPYQLEQAIRGSDGEIGTEDDSYIGPDQLDRLFPPGAAKPENISSEASTLGINVLVSRGEMAFAIECIIQLTSSDAGDATNGGNAAEANYPFTIIRLQENNQQHREIDDDTE